jgi:hypothetical protein
MQNQTFTGIGCFAKPQRLNRIFKKLVQAYTLGPFEESQMREANLIEALMADRTGDICSAGCKNPGFKVSPKITGFYLTVKDQELNLSIFTKTNSARPEIITTSLDGLTKLRQQKLH